MTLLDDYASRTPRSLEHFTRVERLIPAGATRSLNSWPPYPVYLESGSGAHVRDIDGNTYRDFLANYTALPLGYADSDVVSALAEQLSTGTAHSFSRTIENDLASILVTRIPSVQRVRFTASGTESVMFALRLARAVTGRPAIAKAEGGYHGTIDDVMISVRPSLETAGDPRTPAAVPEMAGLSVSKPTRPWCCRTMISMPRLTLCDGIPIVLQPCARAGPRGRRNAPCRPRILGGDAADL